MRVAAAHLDQAYRNRQAMSAWSAPDVARLGMLLALATALHVFEAQLPALPLPGAKMGLANLVGLFALYAWGWKEALLVTVLRQVLGSLITGTLLSPTFAFGMAGGVLSVMVMAVVLGLARFLGPMTISLLGAASHNVGQLLVAWALLGQSQILYYLPYLLWFAVPSGALVGVAVIRLLPLAKVQTRPVGRSRRVERMATGMTTVGLVVAGVLVGAAMFGPGGDVLNPEAVVRVGGTVHANLALQGPDTYELLVPDGRMLLELDAGLVRVAESTCRHQVCVNTGWIEYAHQSIVCLPYKVMVTVASGADTAAEFDALVH